MRYFFCVVYAPRIGLGVGGRLLFGLAMHSSHEKQLTGLTFFFFFEIKSYVVHKNMKYACHPFEGVVQITVSFQQ